MKYAIQDLSNNLEIYVRRKELEEKIRIIEKLFQQAVNQNPDIEVPTLSLHIQTGVMSLQNLETSLKLSISAQKVSLVRCRLGDVNFLNIATEIEIIDCKSDRTFSIQTNALIKIEMTSSEVNFLSFVDVRFSDLAISKSILGILEFKKVQITNNLFSKIGDETKISEIRILNSDSHGEIALGTDRIMNSHSEIIILLEHLTSNGNFSIFSEESIKRFRLHIVNSKFHKNLSLSGFNCVGEIYFNKTVFSDELIFNHCAFVSRQDTGEKSLIMIQECEVFEKFEFLEGSSDGILVFEKSKIQRDFQIKNVSSLYLIEIKKSEIGNLEYEAGKLQVSSSQVENLGIDSSIINSDLEIFNTNILKAIKLNKTKFLKSFLIHDNTRKRSQIALDANDVTFAHDLDFKNLFINDLHFRVCEINGYANIEGVEFSVPPKIHGTVIKTYLGLSNVSVPVPKLGAYVYLDDYRSLKQIMKAQGNDRYESLFSSCELDCRLAEMNLKTIKNWEDRFEVWILGFYELFNKKGRSLFRPALLLLASFIVCLTMAWMATYYPDSTFYLLKREALPAWIGEVGDSNFALSLVRSLQTASGPLGLIFEANIDFKSSSLILMWIIRSMFFMQSLISTLLIYLLVIGIKRRIRTS
jgi:hypothetical protein